MIASGNHHHRGRRTDLLRAEVEQATRAERRRAVRSLLRRPLLLPEGETLEEFLRVRRHADYLSQWFAHHAGWSLTANAECVRLRKTPARAGDTTRSAIDPKSGEPFDRIRYVLFCVALAVLERGDRQITLGRLAQHIGGMIAAEPDLALHGVSLDPEQQTSRRRLVHVLRLLISLGVLHRVQGDEDRYLRDASSDVLYNIRRPALASLLSCPRSPSLIPECEERPLHEAVLEEPVPNTPEARNRAVRMGLVRRLLDDPAIYYRDLTPEERTYLDRQRPFILRDLEEGTGLVSEVRAEGIALTDLEGDATDLGLPEEGTDGHLTLLLATWMGERLRKDPKVHLTHDEIYSRTARLIREHRNHWRKETKEAGAEKTFARRVLERLAGLGLVRCNAIGVVPEPAIGRFALRMKNHDA